MSKSNHNHTEEPRSFVIRVWQEGPGRWRGKINHVQTQDSRAFTDLEESRKFMAKHLPGMEDLSAVARDKTRHSPVDIPVPSRSRLSSWLPRKRSLRLAMAGGMVLLLAVVTVVFYDLDGNGPKGNLAATVYDASSLGAVFVFILGFLAGGIAIAAWLFSRRKT